MTDPSKLLQLETQLSAAKCLEALRGIKGWSWTRWDVQKAEHFPVKRPIVCSEWKGKFYLEILRFSRRGFATPRLAIGKITEAEFGSIVEVRKLFWNKFISLGMLAFLVFFFAYNWLMGFLGLICCLGQLAFVADRMNREYDEMLAELRRVLAIKEPDATGVA